jgi:glycosyltransferase involved in cell wall biosynthesis
MSNAVLIPAYNPDIKLLSLIKELVLSDIQKIIVVNDGSSRRCNDIFDTITNFEKVVVLQHAVNSGKGAALKTGLNYFYCHLPDYSGIVTVDADGQHKTEDIVNVAKVLANNSNKLVLGTRKFENGTPFRSLVGNILTKQVFFLISGVKISDTQTGLRGINRNIIPKLLTINSNGYEFEMEMLLNIKSWNAFILEHPISTVYINNNKRSHFNPILDSMKIYYVLFRFMFSSIITAIIDYLVFILVYSFTRNIFTSTYAARAVATGINYTLARKFVFHSTDILKTLPKFIMLVVILGFISYNLTVSFVVFLKIPVLAAKILSELTLYITNFVIQRNFIFRKK